MTTSTDFAATLAELEKVVAELENNSAVLWQPHDKCRHCEAITTRLKKQQYLLEDNGYSLSA